MIKYYEFLIESYPEIYSIEDPFAEEDFESWKELNDLLGEKINIVGDDLTVTQAKTINLSERMINSVLIKPNQVGSVSETMKAIEISRSKNYEIMVSHRSAETEDTFICSLAVGLRAEYIKCGAPCRGERISKYNELLRIEEEINKNRLSN